MNHSSRTDEHTKAAPFDVTKIRADFPILHQKLNGKPLVYLDSAATAQKPLATIEAVRDHYLRDNANIHRGVHSLSVRSTEAYEQTRVKAQSLLGASRPEEIVFVRGATEAINLVAHTLGQSKIRRGDEIVITAMEHHSNIVPWQLLCERTGAQLRVAPINDAGELLMDEYEHLLGSRTRLVSITHISNAIGSINPLPEVIRLAHRCGALVLVDGAQAVPHLPVDVCALDVDFYAFSSHKFFGPTGVGVLYGKYDLLESLPPYEGGGEMIKSVTFEKTTYNDLPHRFEAGTPNIAGTVGLGASIDYVRGIGLEQIAAYEQGLLEYATATLMEIPQVRLIGTASEKAAVVSFVIDDVHPHDAGTILDQEGIAIRTGHHCAQPLMARFNVSATCRASFAFYNTRAEVDALASGVRRVIELFSL